MEYGGRIVASEILFTTYDSATPVTVNWFNSKTVAYTGFMVSVNSQRLLGGGIVHRG